MSVYIAEKYHRVSDNAACPADKAVIISAYSDTPSTDMQILRPVLRTGAGDGAVRSDYTFMKAEAGAFSIALLCYHRVSPADSAAASAASEVYLLQKKRLPSAKQLSSTSWG